MKNYELIQELGCCNGSRLEFTTTIDKLDVNYNLDKHLNCKDWRNGDMIDVSAQYTDDEDLINTKFITEKEFYEAYEKSGSK